MVYSRMLNSCARERARAGQDVPQSCPSLAQVDQAHFFNRWPAVQSSIYINFICTQANQAHY